MFGKPPSEWELEKFFRVAPSTVHQMILKLAEKEFINRLPGEARSIKLLVDPDEIPRLLMPLKAPKLNCGPESLLNVSECSP